MRQAPDSRERWRVELVATAPFVSSSTSFWHQFLHFRLTYFFTHNFFLFWITTLHIHNSLSFHSRLPIPVSQILPTVVSLLLPRVPSRLYCLASFLWTTRFLFLVFPYFCFWAVRYIKLAISSAFERTLIHCIVSYRIVRNAIAQFFSGHAALSTLSLCILLQNCSRKV